MPELPFFKDTKNIYCIGRNYREHAKELNNPIPDKPLIFLKSPASLRSLEPVGMAYADEVFDYEAEIVLVLKDHLKLNTLSNSRNLAGVCLGLDLTRRQVQSDLKSKGHPWTLAKNFKGSAVFSSLSPIDKISLENNIEFSFYLNDELKQSGNSKDMMVSPMKLLDEILKGVELFPGDLIFTGTPKGVGKVKVGDKLRLLSQDLQVDETGYL